MKRFWVFLAVLCLAAQPLFADDLRQRVRDAALVTYIHGMTQEIAEAEVGPEGVPYLLELLRDPDFPRRDNVMAFLIFLAYDSDATALVDYLERPPYQDDSPEEFRARYMVPEALGHIAARGGFVARDLLINLMDNRKIDNREELAERVDYGVAVMEKKVDFAPEDDNPFDGHLPDEPSPLAKDSSPTSHLHDLDYANHVMTNNPINDAGVDALLDDASFVFAKEDGSADTACCIQFGRTLPGKTFGTPGDGLDTINSSSELNAVIGHPIARVKVVDYIGWCGGPGSNIIGCGFTPGKGIVLVRMGSVSNEGKLWSHEYGHNAGLGHNPTLGFIMYGSLSSVNNKVTSFECGKFHVPSGSTQANITNIGTCHDNDDDDVMSSYDNCPDVPNAGQGDVDADSVGDSCDNCVSDPNPDQADCDTDTLGDVCDPEIIVPEEIEGLWFNNKTELAWDPTPFRKRVYRGFSVLDGPWHYNDVVVQTINEGNSWNDPDVPPNEWMFYYLVTAFNSCGESPK